MWNFGHLPSFMPKYGNFENLPLSQKPLPIEQKYAEFQRPGLERMYMQLLELKLVLIKAERQGPWAILFTFSIAFHV